MKLLSVVVMFVVVPFVFASDVVWEIANPREQLLWHWPSSTKQKTESQQETNKTQDLPSAPPSPLIAQDNLTSDQEKKPTENQPKQVDNFWWRRENFWPPSFADWAQVVGAAIVAYIGLRTLKQIGKQIRVAALGVKVSRRAAKASEISAAAALKSADVAERALKLTERAYLTIGNWQWSRPEVAHPGSISCFLVNSGRTHAEVFGSYIERLIDKRPSAIPSDYRQRLIKRQGLTIAAQETHQVHVDRNDPIIPPRWEQIRGAVIQLYVFTHVEYDDVFGERYEVGCLVRYDPEARQFLVHDNAAYNYHRKKNKE